MTWDADDRSSRRGAVAGLPDPTRVAPSARPAARPPTRGSVGSDPGRKGSRAVPRIHARDLGRKGPITAFTRLARVHALSIAGDALFAIGLAGTVFFSTDPNQARWKVALYLVLTVAPFAVAAPLIGPALDRRAGGRRWVVFGSAASRALLALLLVRNFDSLWFFPEAFLMLVLSKVHLISKSALVPTTVRTDEELVKANSKLSLLGAVAVVIAAAPGLVLLKIGPPWVLALASIVFVFTAAQAFALPDTKVADRPADAAERSELRSAGIILAASAMSLVRGIVGFLTFLLAFDFKNNERPLWWLGLIAAFAQIGFFLGALAAPQLRRRLVEERIIILSLAATVVMGLVAAKVVDTDEVGAVSGLLLGAALLSFGVGLTSSVAKQGFDALVQRDAPDANRGRSFARFETRFQLIWVLGAFVPVVVSIPPLVGMLMIVAVATFALVSYWVGERQIAAARLGRRPPPDPRGPAVGVVARAVDRRRQRTAGRSDPRSASEAGPSTPSGVRRTPPAAAPASHPPVRSGADGTAPTDPTRSGFVVEPDPTRSSKPAGRVGTVVPSGPIPPTDPTVPMGQWGDATPTPVDGPAVPATAPAPPKPSWIAADVSASGAAPPRPAWVSRREEPAAAAADREGSGDPASPGSPKVVTATSPPAGPASTSSTPPTVVAPQLPFDEPPAPNPTSEEVPPDWDSAVPRWRDS